MVEIAIMIEGQDGLNWPRWQRIARAVEDLGFAGLYRSDHFTNASAPDKDSLEMWVSLTWLASNTQRIEFGPLVSPVSFRDPVFTFKPLEADPRPAPEYSLLFVSLRPNLGLFGTEEYYGIGFDRVDPQGEDLGYFQSEHRPFRAFRPRPAKDGDFLIPLRPGVYELSEIAQRPFLWGNRLFKLTGDARVASRIHITRPGIYDLGTLRIDGGGWGEPYQLVAEGDSFSKGRLERLRKAVAGTEWEQYLDQMPRAPGTKTEQMASAKEYGR